MANPNRLIDAIAKADERDLNTRLEALRLAHCPGHETEDVVERAESYYEFLTGGPCAVSA